MAITCEARGVGPRCEVDEVGTGRKFDCLERVARECLRDANQGIGALRSTFWSTNVAGFVFSGWIAEPASLIPKSVAATGQVFRTLNCDFQSCYCQETICGGFCLPDPGGDGLVDPRPTPPTTDTGGADPDEGPKISDLTFTGSDYNRVIERVYGTQLVYGNIFWASQARTATVYNVQYNGADLPTEASETVQLVDLAIGLVAGPIEDIIRIWADDVLWYSRDGSQDAYLQSGVILNSAALGIETGKPYNADTQTTLYVYTGAEDQEINPLMVDGNTTPAYRGLAYLFIRNYNATDVGGRIPQFRVEVARNLSQSGAQIESTTLLGDWSTNLLIDPSSDAVVSISDTEVVAHSYSTLVQQRKTSLPSLSDRTTYAPVTDKTYLIQSGPPGGLRPTHYVSATGGVVISTTTLPQLDYMIPAVVRLSTGLVVQLFFWASADNLHVFRFDNSSGTITPENLFAVGSPIDRIIKVREYTAVSTGVPRIVDSIYVFAGLNVRRLVLNDSEGKTYFDGTQTPSVYTLPANVVGNDTVGAEVVDVQHIPQMNMFRLMIETAGGTHAIGWNTAGPQWSTTLDEAPPLVAKYQRAYPFPSTEYKWFAGSGALYKLDLTSGQVLLDSSVTATGVAAQYYNPLEDSITYQNGSKVIKRFLSHVTGGSTPMSTVMREILLDSGTPPHLIDTSDLATVNVSGYRAASASDAASVIAQLLELYALNAFETNGTIRVQRRGRGTVVIVGNDELAHSVETGGSELSLTDTFTQIATVAIRYNNPANSYKDSTQNLRRPPERNSALFIENTTHKSIQWPIALTDGEALKIAERILYAQDIDDISARFTVGQQHSHITPGDLIQLVLSNGETRVLVVSETSEEPTLRREITAREVSTDIYLDEASIDGVSDPSGEYDNDTLPRTIAATPVLFAVPKPTSPTLGEHASVIAVLPVGLDDGAPVFVPRDVYWSDSESRTLRAGTIEERTQIGTLLTPPVATVSKFSTDNDSRMIIRFNSPEIGGKLASATSSMLLNNQELNVLFVGRELIQFANFSVDVDGLTVTFSGLLRGLRATDHAIDNHIVGEQCALYTPQSVIFVTPTLSRETDTIIPIGAVTAGTVPDVGLFETAPLIAYNRRAAASQTLRRAVSAVPGGDVRFHLASRYTLYYDLPDDDRVFITGSNQGRTFFAILAAPYDENLFRTHIKQFFVDFPLPNASQVPTDSSYIKRVLTGTYRAAHPIGWNVFYRQAEQAADSVNAYDGNFYMATFTLDDLTYSASSLDTGRLRLPTGYDLVGSPQGFYFGAGETSPVLTSDFTVGSFAHMTTDTSNGL